MICFVSAVYGVVTEVYLGIVSVLTKHSNGAIELVCCGSPLACVLVKLKHKAGQKKSLLCFFGNFWCPVVTLITFSSKLSNF